ncbi:(2,3-dihydroxybenzoyl)adenylate synthase [Motilibacter aurantiacus]|uniref:(2,3-dihydroxybenzoyl)adenylate synthase n=1 Tax=Motilibacter aurantiacus TaxID=2714955 RepID=UPI00140B0011|nr:(2,3-dihydroxybenzoyl)adenylate synthase [Motilibacter aurantiacus]NHC45395.1 (2,3-dihydroxybenzoyl)adenylate synthase [Motilibacter aurantiacus]
MSTGPGQLPGYVPWPVEFAERYRASGYWTGETFGSMLRDLAARHGDRVAVVDGDRRWTYAELDERADQVAAGLHRLGIRPRDRVVLQLPNVAEFFEVVFGLWRVGALPVFALPAHRSNEITYFCSFTEAVAYVVPGRHGGFDYRGLAGEARAAAPTLRHVIVVGDAPGDFTALEDVRAEARPLPAPAPSDVAFLQLSGGSTGVPKLIPRTHDDYLYSVRASAEICALDESSVYLAALPVAHNFPLSSPGALGTLYAGGTVVLAPDPSPATALGLIERERVTITAVVPPLALVWLDSAPALGHDLSSLRVLQVGGSKLSEEVARRVTPTLGCGLQQVFGMAEGLVNYTRLDDPDTIVLTTQGRPISPDDEIRVVDDAGEDVPPGEVGHLLTRGPYTIRGYYRAEEHNRTAFTVDGFYRTGDLVRVTPEGYLVVTGRDKDQINRGGEKIAAEEIENHLLAHPAVHDAAVVAVPDAYLGERSCAVVVPRGSAPTALELKKFLRERGLAAYKVPDLVKFVDAFAHTGVGKVSRKELREALAASLRR